MTNTLPLIAGRNRALSTEVVLKKPRITEKAVRGMNHNTYVFDIDPRANKLQVAAAIKLVYNVTPVKIAVVNTDGKSKQNRRTRKMGTTAANKKAYVYLKKGDTISIM